MSAEAHPTSRLGLFALSICDSAARATFALGDPFVSTAAAQVCGSVWRNAGDAVRLARPGLARPVWRGPVWRGPVWRGPVWRGPVWRGPVWPGTGDAARCATWRVRCGAVQVTWLDVARCRSRGSMWRGASDVA